MLFRSGDAEQGLTALKSGKEIARRIENNVELARAETEFAEVCLRNHDLPGATAALTAAANLCQALESSDRLAMVAALQAKVFSLQNRPTEALARLSEAEKLVADNPCRIFLAEILAVRAEVIEDGGDREGASKLLAQASEQARQSGALGLAEEYRRSSEEVREREFARGLLEIGRAHV